MVASDARADKCWKKQRPAKRQSDCNKAIGHPSSLMKIAYKPHRDTLIYKARILPNRKTVMRYVELFYSSIVITYPDYLARKSAI